MLGSELLQGILLENDEFQLPNLVEEFSIRTGLDPFTDLEQAMLGRTGKNTFLGVARASYDPIRVEEFFRDREVEFESYAGRALYQPDSEEDWKVSFIDDLYQAHGHYAEAEPLFQRYLAIGEKALGPDHPDVARSLNNLAGLYYAQGKYAETEPLFRRSLAIRRKALGPEHPDVAESLNNLAELYRTQGKYAEAEPLHKQSLAIHEKALGPEHPDAYRCASPTPTSQ